LKKKGVTFSSVAQKGIGIILLLGAGHLVAEWAKNVRVWPRPHLFRGRVRGGRILNRNIGNPTREPLPSSLGRGLLYPPGNSRDTGVDIA